MKKESRSKFFLGPLLVLFISFLIYFIRYPIWQYFRAIELIFGMLILSYLAILIVALFLLKKDFKKSLSSVFYNYNLRVIITGVLVGLIYLVLWYSINLLFGSKFEFVSSTILRDYGMYTFYSLRFAFILYLVFSLFGAFVEEVTYRSYIQRWVSSRYSYVVGIIVSTLLFSFQHIHVFQTSWLIQFFQIQFVHVFLFGIVGGYLFFKSKYSIWSIFSMHALINAYSVSVPIVVTPIFPFIYYIVETLSFITIIILVYLLPSS